MALQSLLRAAAYQDLLHMVGMLHVRAGAYMLLPNLIISYAWLSRTGPWAHASSLYARGKFRPRKGGP